MAYLAIMTLLPKISLLHTTSTPMEVVLLPWASWQGEAAKRYGANKTAKLAGYLEQAANHDTPHLVGFGGAYSHLLVAVAEAAHARGWPSTGIVRGAELTADSNPQLTQLELLGMELRFVDRPLFRELCDLASQGVLTSFQLAQHTGSAISHSATIIPEGAAGPMGFVGFSSLFEAWKKEPWWAHTTTPDTTWVIPMGTGATMAAFRIHLPAQVNILGISAFEHTYMQASVANLLASAGHDNCGSWQVFRPTGLGAYGKPSQQLKQRLTAYHAKGTALNPTYAGFALAGLEQWLANLDGAQPPSQIVLVDTGGPTSR